MNRLRIFALALAGAVLLGGGPSLAEEDEKKSDPSPEEVAKARQAAIEKRWTAIGKMKRQYEKLLKELDAELAEARVRSEKLRQEMDAELAALKAKGEQLRRQLEVEFAKMKVKTGKLRDLGEDFNDQLKQIEAEERVAYLMKEIERTTPRSFKGKVGVSYLSDAKFKANLEGMIDDQVPPEMLEGSEASMIAFGLMKEPKDEKGKLRALVVETFRTQAAAYYDPKKNTFFIVKEPTPFMRDLVYIHELQHAVQDQIYGLDDLQQKLMDEGNEDKQQAFRFIVEGEATFLMQLYPYARIGRKPAAQQLAMMRRVYLAQANMPYEQLLKTMEANAAMMGESGKEVLEGARNIPAFMLRSLQDAYFRGAVAIATVFEKKGWKGVDELFKNPPTSTEQLLHPEMLLGERDQPIEVTLPNLLATLGEGWKKVHGSTMGEHSSMILLTEQLGAENWQQGLEAAKGWGGDRYDVFRKEDGRPLAVWKTVWDTEKDAEEFHAAYTAAATARNKERGWPQALVARAGKQVLVVEGAAPELAQRLAQAAGDGS